MTSLLGGLFRVAFFLVAVSFSLGAVLAAFGFAYPLFDAFNHLQPLWFAGTLACLLLTGLFYHRERSRALMIALSATGFLTSGIIMVPEFIASLLARPAVADGAPTYRLITYNLFGLNYDMDGVAAMIRNEDADIVALEEYYPEQRGPLHPLLAKDYPYFSICAGGKRANVAIYARLPFTTRDKEPCNWDAERRTGFLAATFAPATGNSFTVVATQLDWPVQISPLFENKDAADADVFTRIDMMTARQRGEFAYLSNGLETLSGPLLLVGDFNSTSWSYALRRFALDNGLTRETRDLPTFPTLWSFDTWRETPAILPLDHVMSRGGAIVTQLHAGAATGSDHLPVIATFTLAAALPSSPDL